MSVGPLERPGGTSEGPLWPRGWVWSPPWKSQARESVLLFSASRAGPPRKPHFARNIHIYNGLWFFGGPGPENGIPGITTDLATPPLGGQKSPRKSARGSPGPQKKTRALVKAPGTLRAAPRGAQGGPRGGHGEIPQLLLHVPTNIGGFLEMLLWPLFRACFFCSKPDLNWAARGR